jgi:hypothetical protein
MGTNEMKKRIKKMQKNRFDFLKTLYKQCNGSESEYVDVFHVGEELGFNRNLTCNIVDYLQGEDVIDTSIGAKARITHECVRKVEKAVLEEGEMNSEERLKEFKKNSTRWKALAFHANKCNKELEDSLRKFKEGDSIMGYVELLDAIINGIKCSIDGFEYTASATLFGIQQILLSKRKEEKRGEKNNY